MWLAAFLAPLLNSPSGEATKIQQKDRTEVTTAKLGRYTVSGPPEQPWKIGYECESQFDAKGDLVGVKHKPIESKGMHETKGTWLFLLRPDRLCWVRVDVSIVHIWEFKARANVGQTGVTNAEKKMNGMSYDAVFDFSGTRTKTVAIRGPFGLDLGTLSWSEGGAGFFTIVATFFPKADSFGIFDHNLFESAEVCGERTASGQRYGCRWELRWENKKLQKK